MSIFSSLLGIGEEQPRLAPTGTVVTEQSLAEEISPFYKDLLEKSQAFLESELERGYQPYTGQTIADRDPRELQAIQGIESLVGTQAPVFEQAKGLLDIQADKFTPEAAREYMNPYQQAVTDIAKREAIDDFDLIRQKFEKQATGAGGMSGLGTRAAVQTGLLGETLAQNLADIQMKGSAAAFEDARKSFELQKGRERGLAAALPTFATGRLGAESRELSGLQAIGEDERARQQLSLDEAYKDFLEEERFEPRQLERYQSVVQGFPNISTQVRSEQGPVPSQAQRFLSSASGLGALYGSFGGFSPGGFGSAYTPFGTGAKPRAMGGQVRYAAGGGLAGLPVTRAQQGRQAGQGRLYDDDSFIGRVMNAPFGYARALGLTTDQIDQGLGDLIRRTQNLARKEQEPLSENTALSARLSRLLTPSPAQATSVPANVQPFSDMEVDLEEAYFTSPEALEAIRTAEVLYPGFKRDPNSPTGYNLKDDRIQVGSAGMDADEMYQLTAPDRAVLAETQKIDEDKQALQNLLKAQDDATKAKLTALKGAKESKTKRDQARRETEKNRDLVNILSRFSQNILSTDAGGATIGSAFAKSTLEQDPSRQKELDRASTMSEKLEELDAAIATAKADGDLQRARMLLEQRNKMTELNLKRSKLKIDSQKAAADLLFKQYNLNVKQTEMLTGVIKDVVLMGVENDRPAIKDLVEKGFENYPIEPEKIDSIVNNIMLLTSTSAKNEGAKRPSRDQTASQ